MAERKNGGSTINRRQVLRSCVAVGAGVLGSKKTTTEAAPAELFHRVGAYNQVHEEIIFALTADDLPKIQPMLDEYSSKTNVRIRTVPNTYAEHYAKLNINLTQATGAYDVVSLDDPWLPLFAGGEFLQDIGKMLEAKGVDPGHDFVPELGALGEFPSGSGLRGLPWIGSVQVFAWRTDVFQEMGFDVPRTWDEVLSVATSVTEASRESNLFGVGLRGQSGNPAATSFLPILRGFGKDLLDPETSEPQLDTPAALAAIDLHLKLIAQAPPDVENVGHAEHGKNLSTGRIAMSGDIWTDQLLQAANPEFSKVAGKIELGSEPAQPGVQPVNMSGCWFLGIPEGSKKADAALDFIQWITESRQQKRLLLDHFMPATRVSVMRDPDAVERLPFLPRLLDDTRAALPRPRTPHYSALEEIFGQYVAEAVAGQISGHEAMEIANKEMRDLLAREGVLEDAPAKQE